MGRGWQLGLVVLMLGAGGMTPAPVVAGEAPLVVVPEPVGGSAEADSVPLAYPGLAGWQVVSGDRRLPGNFDAPNSAAVDAVGNVYVADTGNRRVQKLAPTGTPLQQWELPRTARGEQPAPRYMAVEPDGGVLVRDTSTLYRYSAQGELLAVVAELQGDGALAVDPTGDVLVVEGGVVYKLTATGERVVQYGQQGTPPGYFRDLRQVTVDPNGNVWVLDGEGQRIQKLSPDGEPLWWWDRPARQGSMSQIAVDGRGNIYACTYYGLEKLSQGGELTWRWPQDEDVVHREPVSAPVIADNGHVYVTLASRVYKLSPGGEVVWEWPRSAEQGELRLWSLPAVDQAGLVYALASPADDPRPRTIQVHKLSPAGEPLLSWEVAVGPNGLRGGATLALDARGQVYVSDDGSFGGRVRKFSPTGEALAQWVSAEEPGKRWSAPSEIQVDPAGQVYVRDGSRLTTLAPGGEVVAQEQGPVPGSAFETFLVGTSFALNGAGQLFFTEPHHDQIQRRLSSGETLTPWGVPGGAPGEVRSAAAVAVDSTGMVFVADGPYLHRFAPSGEPMGRWDLRHHGMYHQLHAVATAQDHIYLTDSSSLVKLALSGDLDEAWSPSALALRPQLWISSLAVDAAGVVYLTDNRNHGLLRFSATGELLGRSGIDLYEPLRLHVDPEGQMLVYDAGPERIQRLNQTGGLLEQRELGRGHATHFAELAGRTVDGDGNTYVVGSRARVFEKRDPDGGVLAAWEFLSTDLPSRPFSDTVSTVLALDSVGTAYVATSRQSCSKGGCIHRDLRLWTLREQEEHPAEWATTSEDTSTAWPPAFVLGAQDELYYGAGDRIRKLSPSGELLAEWGGADTPAGRITAPFRLVLDGAGALYVLHDHIKIRKLSPTGVFLSEWGARGSLPGQFDDPGDLALDAAGALYVADTRNRRIQKLPANVPANRSGPTATWTGAEVLVWGGVGDTGTHLGDGARYDPLSDQWGAVATTGAPSARADHTVVWTGAELLVWGGNATGMLALGDGARYDPRTNSWRAISPVNAPSPRAVHTAVWTGTEMLIWGGLGPDKTSVGDGGRYDPATDTWTPITELAAPAARYAHTAVWTGSEMLIWAGYNGGIDDGARYSPTTDTWAPMAATNAPRDPSWHRAVWTGTEMLVFGGIVDSETSAVIGGRYHPASDTWVAMSSSDAPSPRVGHGATWTGTELVVWGGYGYVTEGDRYRLVEILGDGARYAPATDTWIPITTEGAPGRRALAELTWTGSELIVWGGDSSLSAGRYDSYADGARYDPRQDRWGGPAPAR